MYEMIKLSFSDAILVTDWKTVPATHISHCLLYLLKFLMTYK